ncbi:MAG: DUF2845 domain-containing protein [Methylobacter sp.]
MKKITIGVLVLSLYSFNAAYAFKCGRELVQEGDTRADILALCGEPDSVETHYEVQSRKLRFPFRTQDYQEIVEVEVEEWTYNFGRLRFKQYLRFENGVLKEIKSLGRGY